MITITKYPNRRLYISKKGYVPLIDVVKLIRKGETVMVIDKESGKDITAEVLVTALYECDLLRQDAKRLHDVIRGAA